MIYIHFFLAEPWSYKKRLTFSAYVNIINIHICSSIVIIVKWCKFKSTILIYIGLSFLIQVFSLAKLQVMLALLQWTTFPAPLHWLFRSWTLIFIPRTCLSGFPNHNLDLLTNIIIIPLACIITFKWLLIDVV